MLITPTGIPYEHLTEESIVYVDAQGRHEEDKLPSSEWRFHQVVYQTRPDANAVVHNHAVNCTAVSILNRPIPAIHYMIAAAETPFPARLTRPSGRARCQSMSRSRYAIAKRRYYSTTV